jgi:hypothetical protein
MFMKTAKSVELKQIVHEILGGIASNLLLNNVCALLDEDHKDSDSLKQACNKIEKMVNLFIGSDKAQLLATRFGKALN